MPCVIKFYNRLGKRASEAVELIKGAYKNRRFGESTIIK